MSDAPLSRDCTIITVKLDAGDLLYYIGCFSQIETKGNYLIKSGDTEIEWKVTARYFLYSDLSTS